MNSNFNKITTASYILVSLMLSSCELLNPPLAAKIPLPPIKKDTQEKVQEAVFVDLQNKKPVSDSKAKSEFYPGTDRFVANASPQHPKTKASGEGSYSLNFDDADLGEVAKVILGDILGQNYVLSPKVTGKVTLQTTEPLTKEELLPTLEMVLRMNNAALVKDGRIYHIEPAGDAIYSSSISSGRSGYQTRVIPVRYVAVKEIVDIIKPLVHDKTILSVDDTRNILVASGSADEISRVMDLVNTFDIDVLKGRSFGLFPLAHVDPETIIKELEGIFYQQGKADGSAFFQFVPIERLNAVLAVTHQARYLEDIESWVSRLDRANTASGGGVNVYKVQHVDAVDLAGTLNEIFTGAAKKDKSAKIAPGEKSASMTNKKPTDNKQRVEKSSTGSQPAGDANVANVGEVRIIADEPNNSIIIVATAQDYEVILPVIKQLDMMPLQVLIDATIVEVTLKDELKYGMQWFFESGNFKTLLSQVGSGDLSGFGPLTGYSLLYTGGSVKAVLNALADKSMINVIASPSLMVLNNQEGSINVGDKVPIATSQSTNTNSANTSGLLGGQTNAIVANNIQMVETGVTLDITPRVNAGGLVIMDIEQQANQAIPTSTSTLNSPTIQQRKIKSSIVVKGGETIVLGGLIQEQVSNTLTGMPYLSSLPIIGPLFGSTDKKNNRTELVVLITPRVVENEQNARDVTNEFKQKLSGIYRDSSRGRYVTTLQDEEELIQ